MLFFRASLAVIESTEYTALHTAVNTTLECIGRERYDCGRKDPFAQQNSPICNPIRTLGEVTDTLVGSFFWRRNGGYHLFVLNVNSLAGFLRRAVARAGYLALCAVLSIRSC